MKYFGEDGVAAVTIIMYVYYFFIAIYMGIAEATAPIVSYNVGSRNYEKIKETTRYSFVTIAVSSALILRIFPSLWKTDHSFVRGRGECFYSNVGWIKIIQSGFSVYWFECISVRILYRLGEWIYLCIDFLFAVSDFRGCIYSDPAESDRGIRRLDHHAPGRGGNYFHSHLFIPYPWGSCYLFWYIT